MSKRMNGILHDLNWSRNSMIGAKVMSKLVEMTYVNKEFDLTMM